MDLQVLLRVTGILLLLCFLRCCAKEGETECAVSKHATDVNRRCLLPHNFASSDYKCSHTSKVLCGKTTLVGEDSVCMLVDDPGVHFSCRHGKWTIGEANHLPTREKRSLLLVLGGVVAVFCFFFCGSGNTAKQNRPPSFTSCPADIIQNAKSGQTEAVVTWTKPSASDPDGETPSISGPTTESGSSFPEGSTQITYRARDSMGFTDYCSFTVRVIVTKCPSPRYVLHATQTCDHNNVYGSVCTHTCDPGYRLPGSAMTYASTCGQSGQWSPDFPKCEPVSCGSPHNVSGGQVACPRQPVYPEYCSVICDKGFQHTGSYFVACQEDASWSPAQPCLDREAPTIACPPNQQLISGPLLSPISVTWPNPVTKDNGGGKVTIISNPSNGSLLAPGFHLITTTAADASGNIASCNFLVTIQGRKCPTLSAPSYGRVTCTSGYVEGSECTVSCYPGYQVRGEATVRCLQSELWNASLPACEAVNCRVLPQVARGRFVCPSGQQYPSVCTLLCDTGFTIHDAAFIQCLPEATWTAPGTCLDVEAPQFPNGCPDNIEINQHKLGSQARVTWKPPVVTDNSGGIVNLKSDVPSNSTFPVGISWVMYTATDVSNNSRSCRFSVTVTTLSCTAPNFDSSGNGLMLYECPNGYVYGATCMLSCAYGYPLVGANTITCGSDNSTYPPTMKWEWPGPSAVAPVCRENNCTDLRLPQNGALTCNLGNFGWDCLMSCHIDWDVPAQTNGHFYCTNSNKYWTPPAVPDCIVKIRPGGYRLNTDFFYYANTCNVSIDELKTKFVQRMNNSDILRDACVNTCHLENLKVYCGPVTGRRRRDVGGRYNHFVIDTPRGIHGRFRRQTGQLIVRFEFEIVHYYNKNSTSSEQTYQSVQNMTTDLYNRLQVAANARQLDFGSLVAGEYTVGYPKIALDCPRGTFFRPKDNTVFLSCAGCGPGHYLPYDSVTGARASNCSQCPVGSYTNLDNATTCTPCPPGWSTANTGSKNSTDCKELCPAGSVSYNGFTPCQPCPPGRYQSRHGAMTCDLCPAGTWTALIGAPSMNHCIPVDECLRTPCGTHPCENRPGGFVCNCLAGWTGVACKTPPDSCYNHQCHNGATCLPGKNNYTCTCTQGYTGRLCDTITVDGRWGDWSPWTACTATCGGGQQQRQRLCNNPAPLNSGLDCTGSGTETVSCGAFYCPVNGNWSVWEQWTACSANCKGGQRTRRRTCNNPVPQHNGSNCAGIGIEEETCNTDLCPVDGGWSEFSIWTQCSVSCGGGTMSRNRTCTNPPPANGGRACSGNQSQTEICNAVKCPECPQLVRHVGSLFFCNKTTGPFLQVCNLTCAPGYISATPLPLQFSCGEPTNYLWSHQGNASRTIELPDTCRVPTSAKLASFESTVPMNAGCDAATSAAMKKATEKNLADQVECRLQNAYPCQTEVSTACDSGGSGRSKRSPGSLVLIIKITSGFGTEPLLYPNDTASIQRYADFLRVMEASAATVIGNTTHNIFTVTTDDQVITPDLAALTFGATLICSVGSVAVEGVCVECPPGYKQENGRCVPCPLGTYQDQAGSTSCKSCPSGLKWDILGAFSVHQCLYVYRTMTTAVTYPNNATASPSTERPASAGGADSDDHINVVGVIVGTVCASVVILGLAITLAVYKCRKNKTRADTMRNQSSSLLFELPTVIPFANKPNPPCSTHLNPPSYADSVAGVQRISVNVQSNPVSVQIIPGSAQTTPESVQSIPLIDGLTQIVNANNRNESVSIQNPKDRENENEGNAMSSTIREL